MHTFERDDSGLLGECKSIGNVAEADFDPPAFSFPSLPLLSSVSESIRAACRESSNPTDVNACVLHVYTLK